MRKLTAILIILFSFCKSIACSCDDMGNFLKVAPAEDFVALVKVIKYLSYSPINDKPMPMSMEVEILDVYQGTEIRKTIRVWGDNGALCRPYLSNFTIGGYYVIAFYIGVDGSKVYGHKEETTNDYAISVCGEYWMPVNMASKEATSITEGKERKLRLLYLKSKLKKLPIHSEVKAKPKFLHTGWYYIEGFPNEYLRQIDSTKERFYIVPKPIVTTKNFTKVEVRKNIEGYYYLYMKFDTPGTKAWRVATGYSVGNRLAFIVNNKLVYTAKINSQITEGVSALFLKGLTKEQLENYKVFLQEKRSH